MIVLETNQKNTFTPVFELQLLILSSIILLLGRKGRPDFLGPYVGVVQLNPLLTHGL